MLEGTSTSLGGSILVGLQDGASARNLDCEAWEVFICCCNLALGSLGSPAVAAAAATAAWGPMSSNKAEAVR